MSVAGILSSSLLTSGLQSFFQGEKQQFQQKLQQLGADLQSGNLSASQSDLAALTRMGWPPNSSSSTSSSLSNSSASPSQSTNSLSQDYAQLSADLQSGNLSAAQQDYAKIQQDSQAPGAHLHGHHHRRGGGAGTGISQLMDQLGQSLQSGNLTAAQQAYNSLQQDFQQLGQSLYSQGASSSGTNLSFSA